MQVGSQGLNIGRNAVLAAGFPESVPATTVDRQCGSSQQSAHFAAQGVIAGAYDVVVAAGVEVMSTTPMGASITPGSIPFGPGVIARYADQGGLVPAGHLGRADRRQVGPVARGARRVRRAEPAAGAARHRGGPLRQRDRPVDARLWDKDKNEVVELGEQHTKDEGIRPGTTAESLAGLKPAFKPTARSPPATPARSPTAPPPC
jgi:acetyl-CoA acyltransferase